MAIGAAATLAALAGAIVLAACGSSSAPALGPSQESATPVASQTPRPAAPTLAAQPLPSIAGVVERVRPAVVIISAEVVVTDRFRRQARSVQSGTGVVFQGDGHIVTNQHVVQGARRIVVTTDDGRSFEATLVGSDLAVLKIDAGSPLPWLPFADPDRVRVGDWAIAIGNALGLPGGPTVTAGVVGALNRAISTGDRYLTDLLQTDAAINEGNSGGPLVNLDGEIIGINTVAVQGAQGIGFSIGTFTVVPVVQSILQHGRVVWPWLGVVMDDITPGATLEMGLTAESGILVRGVWPGGPAAEAGVAEGDVIVAVEGQPVSSVRDLQRLMRGALRVGQGVTLEVDRRGGALALEAVLAEMPR